MNDNEHHFKGPNAWAIALVMVAMMLSGGAAFWIQHTFFDNSAPVKISSQVPLDTQIEEGGVYRYKAFYSKRRDCKGVGGHYRIEGVTDEGHRIDLQPFRKRVQGTWAPGDDQVATVSIEFPRSLTPGKYEMWWTWVYECDRATKQLTVISPRLPVYVVPKT